MVIANLRQVADWRGHGAYDLDGVKVGVIHEIVYDYASVEPVWLGIHGGFVSIRTQLVPVEGATFLEGDVFVPYTRDVIEHAPHVDLGQGFDSFTDERDLYEYFGVTLNPDADFRVLHEGDEFPGGQAVIDNGEAS